MTSRLPEFPLDVLCEDGPLLAFNKPAGLPTQGVPADVLSLESQVKAYLKQKYDKPGNVYLGIPHRLDRPVSGVVIFARNSKAAARLAEQFRLREVRKLYLAVVEGRPEPPAGQLVDWLLKDPDVAHACVVSETTPGAKRAALSYRVLETLGDRSLVEIELETGRMHQIRVQFAARSWPIVGDRQYGAATEFPMGTPTLESPLIIALHAARLELRHPIRYDSMTLQAPPPSSWQQFGFLPAAP